MDLEIKAAVCIDTWTTKEVRATIIAALGVSEEKFILTWIKSLGNQQFEVHYAIKEEARYERTLELPELVFMPVPAWANYYVEAGAETYAGVEGTFCTREEARKLLRKFQEEVGLCESPVTAPTVASVGPGVI
jgi:hypothetical protein